MLPNGCFCGVPGNMSTAEAGLPIAGSQGGVGGLARLCSSCCCRRKCSRLAEALDMCGEAYFRYKNWEGRSSLLERLRRVRFSRWSWVSVLSGRPRIPRARAKDARAITEDLT